MGEVFLGVGEVFLGVDEVFLGVGEVLLVTVGKVFPETEGGVLCLVAEEVMLEIEVHLE